MKGILWRRLREINVRSGNELYGWKGFKGYMLHAVESHLNQSILELRNKRKWCAPTTELRKSLCTWLRECCRQVEAEVISNSRNKLHQTTYNFSQLCTGVTETVLPRFGEFCCCCCLPLCLALPIAFTQPGDHLLAKPCTPRYLHRPSPSH